MGARDGQQGAHRTSDLDNTIMQNSTQSRRTVVDFIADAPWQVKPFEALRRHRYVSTVDLEKAE